MLQRSWLDAARLKELADDSALDTDDATKAVGRDLALLPASGSVSSITGKVEKAVPRIASDGDMPVAWPLMDYAALKDH